jgi:hypothetical protein
MTDWINIQLPIMNARTGRQYNMHIDHYIYNKYYLIVPLNNKIYDLFFAMEKYIKKNKNKLFMKNIYHYKSQIIRDCIDIPMCPYFYDNYIKFLGLNSCDETKQYINIYNPNKCNNHDRTECHKINPQSIMFFEKNTRVYIFNEKINKFKLVDNVLSMSEDKY